MEGKARRKIKNQFDRRYTKVQSAIDRVIGKFIRHGHIAGMCVTEVSREANIYTSTFYEHHQNLDEAIQHFDSKMQNDLNELMTETLETKSNLEVLYSKLLYFIFKHKEYYASVINSNNIAALLLAVAIIKPKLTEAWKDISPPNFSYKFTILSWTICGEIWWWGAKENFKEESIPKLAKKLIKLTRSARLNY